MGLGWSQSGDVRGRLGCVGLAGWGARASWVKGITRVWASLQCGPKQVMGVSTMQRVLGWALATEALPVSLLAVGPGVLHPQGVPVGAAGHPVLLCPEPAALGPCFWASAFR